MKNTIYVFKRTLNICKDYKIEIFIIVLFLFITTAISLLPTIIIKNILDSFFSNEFNTIFLMLIIALFIIPVLNAGLQLFHFSISTKISFKIMMNIKEKMINRLLHSKLSAASKKNAGE